MGMEFAGDQLDLADIYTTFQQTAAEHMIQTTHPGNTHRDTEMHMAYS